MMNRNYGAAFRQIDILMRTGTVANFTDTELLDRFLARGDGGEAAFEALVNRHGSMVLGVCRQILNSSADVDDAFQATFLVLVRQAGSIRKKDSLGPWLHGVARRVAFRARRDAARRRLRETTAIRAVGAEPPDESLAATLHEEIARLPEKYRTPIVLCDLEGRSHADAALHLDWPIGTVSGRLSRARALLRSRIARRGLALTSGFIVTMLNTGCSSPVISAIAMSRVVRMAASQGGRAKVTASVASLAAASSPAKAWLLAKIAAGVLASATLGWTSWNIGGGGSQEVRDPVRDVESTVATIVPAAPPSVVRRRLLDEESGILAFAIAPDGLTLASGSVDATVTIWDLKTGFEKRTLIGHEAAVTALEFARDGKTLASTSADHTVRCWDVASGQPKFDVSWLHVDEAPPLDLGSESLDSGRGAPGRDRCADGPIRDGAPTGA